MDQQYIQTNWDRADDHAKKKLGSKKLRKNAQKI